MHPSLAQTAHRPYPPPHDRPWIMEQQWNDLLFAHWPLPPDEVRAAMPAAMREHLDVREGAAWVGVFPFWMSGVRLRVLPALPGLSRFPELNVRTYVTLEGKPGVYFFSLDAGNLPAVMGARLGFALRYFYAAMKVTVSAGDEVEYSSRRKYGPRPGDFAARYRPSAATVFVPQPGTLESFLVDRYCLYSVTGKKVLRGEIHHLPWRLQPASAEISELSVAESHGLKLPATAPHLMFSKHMEMIAWAPRIVHSW